MALNQMGLGFLFTAKDEASHVMAKIDRSFGKLTGNTRELTKTNLVAGALGAMAMAGGIKALGKAFEFAKEAGDFNQALIDVQSISGGTAEELKKLHDAAMEAGIKTQFAPQEAVEGLRQLAQHGYNATDSLKMLRPSLDLAAGSLGQLNVEASSSTLAQTIKAFKLSTTDAAITADKLLAVHRFSSVQIRELPSLIGHVARGSASFGASLEEALAASGLARNVIGNIELASTGVSMAMERLTDPKVQKVLHGIGVSAVDATGHFKPFLNILLDITNSPLFKGKTQAEQAGVILKAFGHRSLAAVNAIQTQLSSGITTHNNEIVRGADAVKYLRSELEGAAGMARRFADRRLDTLPGQLLLLRSSVKEFRLAIGEELTPIFRPLVQGFLHYFNEMLFAWQRLAPETRQLFARMALGVAALVTAFGALVSLKAGILVLSAVFGMLGTSLGAVAWSMVPVLAGVLALAAVSYLAYQAYKTNFGGLADSVNGAWQKVSLAVRGIVQLFSSGYFSGDVMKAMDDVKNRGVREFVITIFMWGSRLKNFFEGVKNGFLAFYSDLEPVLGGLKDSLGRLASAFGLNIGKAEDNAAAFDEWGQRGRDVGAVLAQLAILFVDALAFSIDVVAGAVKSLRDNWVWLKPALLVVAGIGIASWASGAATAISAFAASMGTLGLASLATLGWLGAVVVAMAAICLLIPKVLDFFGIKDVTVTPGAGLQKFMSEPAHGYSPESFQTSASEQVDASGNPLWMGHRGAGDATTSPAVAAQNSGREDLSGVLARLTKTLEANTGKSGASGGGAPPQQINLNVDGQRLASVLADAQKALGARSYQSGSSGESE